MNILVTGVGGQLGHDVVNELDKRGHICIGTGSAPAYHGVADGSVATRVKYVQMELSDERSVKDAVRMAKPDAVIHCAGWTAVDAAEDEENREKVDRINRLGSRYLAEAVKEVDAKLIYISTDYVFDGSGTSPRKTDDECRAVNVYGKSKLDGENEVRERLQKYFIVRISWAFGLNGNNFVKTMINAGKKRDEVRVVDDQIGTPTYTLDLARLLADMAESDKYGTYHATNEGGYISWYEFCCEIYRQYGLNTWVIPVTTEEYGISKAERPRNSRLDKSKLVEMGFRPLPTWQDAVARYLKEADL